MKKNKKNLYVNLIWMIAINLVKFCTTFYLLDEFNIFDNLLNYNSVVYVLIIALIIFGVFYIMDFFADLIHNIGHLLFGLDSNMEFKTFNIYGLQFYKKDDKLKIRNSGIISDKACLLKMRFKALHKYSNSEVVNYYLGGIILNTMICVLCSILVIIYRDNFYILLIFLNMLYSNFYLIVSNLIPTCLPNGRENDRKLLENYDNDKFYIKKCIIADTLNDLYESEGSIKNALKELVYLPVKILNTVDFDLTIHYIDYNLMNKKYKVVSSVIEKILDSDDYFIAKDLRYILKSELIICYFYLNDINKIKNILDDKLRKYIDYRSSDSILYLTMNYGIALLIDENKSLSKTYLRELKKMDVDNKDKYLEIVDCINNFKE